MKGIEGESGPVPVVRRRRSLDERIAERRRVEQERVRLLRDYAEGCGGSVRRTLTRLSAEMEGGDPVVKSQDMMIPLCPAFELDLAQARCVTEWGELGIGGQVSGEQLEEVVGARFAVRGRGLRAHVLRRAATGASAVPDQDSDRRC